MRFVESSHGIYSLSYYIVWVTKYRRRILNPDVVDYLKKMFPKLIRSIQGVEIEEIGFKNQDKVFYFFGKCNKGYLKADMAAIANRTEDFCELIAIPHPEKISKVTHKPLEVPFVYPLVFARLNLR